MANEIIHKQDATLTTDAQDMVNSAVNTAQTVRAGVKAAKTAVKTAKAAVFLTKKIILLLASLSSSSLITFLLIILFLTVIPLNTGIFGNLQTPDTSYVQVYEDFEGRDLTNQANHYDFMIAWENAKELMTELWKSIFHMKETAERDRIMDQYNSPIIADKNVDVEDNAMIAYNQASDGVMNLLDGAFKKGWTESLQIAKKRAEMVKGHLQEDCTRPNLVDVKWKKDKSDDKVFFDADAYFENTDNWKSNIAHYELGTFTESADLSEVDLTQYDFVFPDGNTITQTDPTIKNVDSVRYLITYQAPDKDKVPTYVSAILKLVAYQNCTEFITDETTDEDGNTITTYGIPVQFSDSGLSVAETNSTEYQLMRLGNEIGGRAIRNLEEVKEQELSKDQVIETKDYSNKPIYKVAITVMKPKAENKSVLVYRNDYTLSNDTDEDATNQVYVDGAFYKTGTKVYSHTEVYTEVSVIVKYNVVLSGTYDRVVQDRITKDYNAEQKAKYADAVGEMYKANVQVLRMMYGMGGGGGLADLVQLALEQVGNDGSLYMAWAGSDTHWCAIFAAWCLDQCGISRESVAFSASCSTWTTGLQSLGMWLDPSTTPEPGMLIFFHHGHVGIVERVEGDTVYTIEGNVGSNNFHYSTVMNLHHSIYNPDIAGYAYVGGE